MGCTVSRITVSVEVRVGSARAVSGSTANRAQQQSVRGIGCLLASNGNEGPTGQLRIGGGDGANARRGGSLSIKLPAGAGRSSSSVPRRLWRADHRPGLSGRSGVKGSRGGGG